MSHNIKIIRISSELHNKVFSCLVNIYDEPLEQIAQNTPPDSKEEKRALTKRTLLMRRDRDRSNE